MGHARRIFKVVRRQEAEQSPANLHGLVVILGDEVNHSRLVHLRVRATKFLSGHYFSGNLLDHLRPGDEHLALAGFE